MGLSLASWHFSCLNGCCAANTSAIAALPVRVRDAPHTFRRAAGRSDVYGDRGQRPGNPSVHLVDDSDARSAGCAGRRPPRADYLRSRSGEPTDRALALRNRCLGREPLVAALRRSTTYTSVARRAAPRRGDRARPGFRVRVTVRDEWRIGRAPPRRRRSPRTPADPRSKQPRAQTAYAPRPR